MELPRLHKAWDSPAHLALLPTAYIASFLGQLHPLLSWMDSPGSSNCHHLGVSRGFTFIDSCSSLSGPLCRDSESPVCPNAWPQCLSGIVVYDFMTPSSMSVKSVPCGWYTQVLMEPAHLDLRLLSSFLWQITFLKGSCSLAGGSLRFIVSSDCLLSNKFASSQIGAFNRWALALGTPLLLPQVFRLRQPKQEDPPYQWIFWSPGLDKKEQVCQVMMSSLCFLTRGIVVSFVTIHFLLWWTVSLDCKPEQNLSSLELLLVRCLYHSNEKSNACKSWYHTKEQVGGLRRPKLCRKSPKWWGEK